MTCLTEIVFFAKRDIVTDLLMEREIRRIKKTEENKKLKLLLQSVERVIITPKKTFLNTAEWKDFIIPGDENVFYVCGSAIRVHNNLPNQTMNLILTLTLLYTKQHATANIQPYIVPYVIRIQINPYLTCCCTVCATLGCNCHTAQFLCWNCAARWLCWSWTPRALSAVTRRWWTVRLSSHWVFYSAQFRSITCRRTSRNTTSNICRLVS